MARVERLAGQTPMDGDHIANPTGSEPIFLDLGGSNNTYNLTGANLKLDTRKLDGFGRALGHELVACPVESVTPYAHLIPGLGHGITAGRFILPLVEGRLEESHQRQSRRTFSKLSDPGCVSRVVGRCNIGIAIQGVQDPVISQEAT